MEKSIKTWGKQKKIGDLYNEDQISRMFESLSMEENKQINFAKMLTAYSYQRLVAVDERLWEAFNVLDTDRDGKITAHEILSVMETINKSALKETRAKLFKIQQSGMILNQRTKPKDINNIMEDAGIDRSGEIDYDDFLRSLHPKFNEPPVTPLHARITPTEHGSVFTFKSTENVNDIQN